MRSVSVSSPFGAFVPIVNAPPAWRPQLTLKQAAQNDSPYLGLGPQGLKAVVQDAQDRTAARFFSSGLLPRACGLPGMPPCDTGTPQSALSGLGSFGATPPSNWDLAFTFAETARLRTKVAGLRSIWAARSSAEGFTRRFWGVDDGGGMLTRIKQIEAGVDRLLPTGEYGAALRAGTMTPERYTATFNVWANTANDIAKDLREQPFVWGELFQAVKGSVTDTGRVVNAVLPQPSANDNFVAWMEKNGKTVAIAGVIGVSVLGLAYVSGSLASIIRAVKS